MVNSTIEGGHAKNVTNYEDLLAGIAALGTAYNPARAGLKLAAMQTQLTTAKTALNTLSTVMPTYSLAVDAREAAFATLDKLVTRVVNLYKASVTNKLEAETAISLQRKIRGAKAAAKPVAASEAEDDGTQKRKHSTSQRSYDMRSEHFDQLIRVVNANPAYAPNEADLKVAGLNSVLADLRSKSAAVTIAEIAVDNARHARDKQLYTYGTGLVDTANDARNYVRALFGTNSPQVKQVSSFRFRKIAV